MKNSILHRCRHHYRVYGLTLGANIAIPGLAAEKVEPRAVDITINIGFFPEYIQHVIAHPSAQYYLELGYEKEDPPHLIVNELAKGRYFHFYYEYGVEFVFDQKATIVWGRWKAPLVREDASLYLLGPIIGFMLRLRGITCLHASGVVVDGKAFALTGPSGAGKSTLAASFVAAGYSILTDDVLPVTAINDVIYAHAGYSRLRLFPNSFEKLQELPDNLPLLAPGWDKCYLDLAADSYAFHESSTVLKVIYIIDWSTDNAESPSIASLSGAATVPLLAANTYRNELLTPDMRKSEFVFLSQLVSKVKVKKIYPVDDIATVTQLREMLIEDFQRESASQNNAIPEAEVRRGGQQ